MLALVLSRYDFKEFDQVISLYTEKEGRRDCTVRGVKKITSKNTSHLEPGSLISLGIAQGKDRDIITSVQIESYFSNIRKDYFRSLCAMWGLGCVEQWFRVPQPDPAFFSFLVSWFSYIDSCEKVSPYVLDAFAVRTLGFLGFQPVGDRCVECEVKNSNSFFFSPSKGGLICAECKNFLNVVQQDCFEMDKNMLHAFQLLLTCSWDECSEFFQEKGFYEHLHKAVYVFVRYHTVSAVVDWINLANLSNFFEYKAIFSPSISVS